LDILFNQYGTRFIRYFPIRTVCSLRRGWSGFRDITRRWVRSWMDLVSRCHLWNESGVDTWGGRCHHWQYQSDWTCWPRSVSLTTSVSSYHNSPTGDEQEQYVFLTATSIVNNNNVYFNYC